MEENADDNIYVLSDDFMEHDADQLLALQNEFSPRKAKQIFTLEGFQDEDGILIEDETVNDILQFPIVPKEEPVESIIDAVVDDEAGPSNAHLPVAEAATSVSFVEEDDTALPLEISDDSYIIEHIDIRAPVSHLRTLLEKKLNVNLAGYEIWLQNCQKMNPDKNLVDQCIQGEGLVQINLEIIDSERKINIADVLKPTEEFLEAHKSKSITKKNSSVQWMVDNNFRKEMTKLEIPEDPKKWTKEQVKLWFIWAVRQFNIPGVKLCDWTMTGKELCDMSVEKFREICPKDRGDFFWTHLELLRRCGFLAIVTKPEDKIVTEEEEPPVAAPLVVASTAAAAPPPVEPRTPQTPQSPVARMTYPKKSRILGSNSAINERRTGLTGSNNGQIQLWQFLLELLTDKAHRHAIYWLTDDGEFKLENPEMVAALWGIRKNKPAMTYEKLSRALRYYYDGDMIAKVPGKRFVYKFVCDLKELLGYSAAQLNKLVTECAEKNGIYTDHFDLFTFK